MRAFLSICTCLVAVTGLWSRSASGSVIDLGTLTMHASSTGSSPADLVVPVPAMTTYSHAASGSVVTPMPPGPGITAYGSVSLSASIGPDSLVFGGTSNFSWGAAPPFQGGASGTIDLIFYVMASCDGTITMSTSSFYGGAIATLTGPSGVAWSGNGMVGSGVSLPLAFEPGSYALHVSYQTHYMVGTSGPGSFSLAITGPSIGVPEPGLGMSVLVLAFALLRRP